MPVCMHITVYNNCLLKSALDARFVSVKRKRRQFEKLCLVLLTAQGIVKMTLVLQKTTI